MAKDYDDHYVEELEKHYANSSMDVLPLVFMTAVSFMIAFVSWLLCA